MSEHLSRRPHSWAVLELTRLGERKAEEGTLAPLVRRILSLREDHPVFVPCKSYSFGGRKTTIHLMEGYVFVGTDGGTLHIRPDQPIIKRVMSSNGMSGMRVMSVLADAVVLKMEQELAAHVGEEVRVGLEVSVSAGVYKGMKGVVLDIADNGNPIVRFTMRSLDTIVEITRDLIVPCSEDE